MIPSGAKDAMSHAGEETGNIMKAFTKNLLSVYVQSKITGIIETTITEALGDQVGNVVAGEAISAAEDVAGVGGGDDDKEEEKGGDDSKPANIICSGAQIIASKNLIGPDKNSHWYYSITAAQISPAGSVLTTVTKKHSNILAFTTDVKKTITDAADIKFPGKKKMGKNAQYYKDRLDLMKQSFEIMNEDQHISSNDAFMQFFELIPDPKRAEQLEIFKSALEKTCDENEIDYGEAMDTCENWGAEGEESDMLTAVVLSKVDPEAMGAIREAIRDSMLGKVGFLQKRAERAASKTVGKTVGTTVTTSWSAAKDQVQTIIEAVGTAIEQGSAPIVALLKAALDPIGKMVKAKLSPPADAGAVDAEEKTEPTDQTMSVAKLSWLAPLPAAITEEAKIAPVYEKIAKQIETFKSVGQWTPYLSYVQFPAWCKKVPVVGGLLKQHEKLVKVVCEAWGELAVAVSKACVPIFVYKDELESSGGLEPEKHKTDLARAVRNGGLALAEKYIVIKRKITRSTRRTMNKDNQKLILKMVDQIAIGGANMMGQIAFAFNPAAPDQVRQSFLAALEPATNKYLQSCATKVLTTVRVCTQMSVADVVKEEAGDAIAAISETLNELGEALPDPIKEHVKIGDMVVKTLEKFVTKLANKIVVKLSFATEQNFWAMVPPQ